jgi:hypothetical protein
VFPLLVAKGSFYQDGLGTTIGKVGTQKRETVLSQRDSVWRSICLARLKEFHPPRRARRSFMRLFLEQMILREKRIEESAQVKKWSSFAPFEYKHVGFNKRGSGQT